jgi:hypothetical protein
MNSKLEPSGQHKGSRIAVSLDNRVIDDENSASVENSNLKASDLYKGRHIGLSLDDKNSRVQVHPEGDSIQTKWAGPIISP